ncbi:MAG TPA: hypothetical protein VIM11_19225 [Tepidisphaeraceae bacterium]|jgi:hypothetical protein
MPDYAPWYWDWWDDGRDHEGRRRRDKQRCEKEKSRAVAKPAQDVGKEWVEFVQSEFNLKNGKFERDPAADAVHFWVRCKDCGCKKQRVCDLINVMVLLPSGKYVNDVKCACIDKKQVTTTRQAE